MLVKPIFCRVDRDNEWINKSDYFKIHNHVCNMFCVTSLRITEPWSVDDYNGIILFVTQSMSDKSLDLRSFWLCVIWSLELALLSTQWISCRWLAVPRNSNHTNRFELRREWFRVLATRFEVFRKRVVNSKDLWKFLKP